MKKVIAAIMVFYTGLLIFAGRAYGDELTGQEEKIYYDYWESDIRLFDSDQAEKVTAEKYGISIEDMKSIYEKGVDRPITDQEKLILEEQKRLLKEKIGVTKTINELCQKYGLSESRIRELQTRQTVHALEEMWDRTHDSK